MGAGDAEQLDVDGRVVQTEDGFTASLSLTSSAGVRERRLTDADCVLVADAAAFIVALAIDPNVRAEDAPLTPEERTQGEAGDGGASSLSSDSAGNAVTGSDGAANADGAVDTNASNTSTDGDEATESDDDNEDEADEDDEADAPSEPLTLSTAAGLGVGPAWQPLPAVAARISAYWALRMGNVFRIEMALGYAFERAADVPDTNVQASFDAMDAALMACVVGGRGQTELGVCLGTRAGLVRADTAELSDGTDEALPHAEVLGGPLLLHRLGAELALRIEAWPSIAVARPRFALDDGTEVYQAEILGFAASLGMELRFD